MKHYEVYYLKLHMCRYLRIKFHVSSIFTNLDRGGWFYPSLHLKANPQKTKPDSIKRLNY